MDQQPKPTLISRRRLLALGVGVGSALVVGAVGCGGGGGASERRRALPAVLPADRRGTAVVVACDNTVPVDRWAEAVANAVAQGVACGARVELYYGGPTVSDLLHVRFPSDREVLPDGAHALRRRLAALAGGGGAQAAELLTSMRHDPTLGLDVVPLVEASLRWSREAAAACPGPERVLLFATCVQRDASGDVTQADVPAPTLELARSVAPRSVVFVGPGDFNGLQANVANDVVDRVRRYASGLDEQIPGGRLTPSFDADLSWMWTA